MPPSWVWTIGEPKPIPPVRRMLAETQNRNWVIFPHAKQQNSVLDAKRCECFSVTVRFFFVFQIFFRGKIFTFGHIHWIYCPHHPGFQCQMKGYVKFGSGDFTTQKLTWQWKMDHLKMQFLIETGIFQCHVRFQEGSHKLSHENNLAV